MGREVGGTGGNSEGKQESWQMNADKQTASAKRQDVAARGTAKTNNTHRMNMSTPSVQLSTAIV